MRAFQKRLSPFMKAILFLGIRFFLNLFGFQEFLLGQLHVAWCVKRGVASTTYSLCTSNFYIQPPRGVHR
jgi:hypothetical protein